MPSSSTTDAVVAGFRVEGVLREVPGGTVFAARQLSLDRAVSLAVYDPDVAPAAQAAARRQALLHHPGIVSVIETGREGDHAFVATRLVPTTLADVPAPPRRLLGDLAAALHAAHAAGLAHGALAPGTILVEGGRALLADFTVPGDPAAAQAADRRALDALATAWPRPRRRRRGLALAAGAAVVAAAVPIALTDRDERLPAPLPGTVAVGSAAGTGPTRDCDAAAPTPDSATCTLVGVADGSPLTAPADGVVRAWTVRGGRGRLALQVVRARAGGTFGEVNRSQYAVARGGIERFRAAVPVRAGDLLGVELGPGAGIGRGGGTVLRWAGPLELVRAPRGPDTAAVRGGAPAVRFELDRGARPARAPALQGAAARGDGRPIAAQSLELRPGVVVRVTLAGTDAGLVLDLHADGRRRARVPVPGADPAGRLDVLEQGFTRSGLLRLRWRNPDGLVVHAYAVTTRRLERVF